MPKILKMTLPPDGEEGLWVKLDGNDVERIDAEGGLYIFTKEEAQEVRKHAVQDFVLALAQRYIEGTFDA